MQGRTKEPLRTAVALFVFNRPLHTARVLDAIRAARPSQLLVVADGPRPESPDDERLCERTREVIDGVNWPCEVSRLYADVNLGCGRRVATGLDWVFNSVPEAIVLEDDTLPNAWFFEFCEAMLERYRADSRVGMISGTNYFSDPWRRESYFFSRYFSVWGWASWRRAWEAYDYEMKSWPRTRARGGTSSLGCTPGVASYLQDALDQTYAGRIDTWDFQWFYACLVERRLCIVPSVNLVSNIGAEATHGKGGKSIGFPTYPLDTDELVHPEQIDPDIDYELRLYANYLRGSPARAAWQRASAALGKGRRLASRLILRSRKPA